MLDESTRARKPGPINDSVPADPMAIIVTAASNFLDMIETAVGSNTDPDPVELLAACSAFRGLVHDAFARPYVGPRHFRTDHLGAHVALPAHPYAERTVNALIDAAMAALRDATVGAPNYHDGAYRASLKLLAVCTSAFGETL
jgi:hypothetical protein